MSNNFCKLTKLYYHSAKRLFKIDTSLILLFDSLISGGFGCVKVKGNSAVNSPPSGPLIPSLILTLYCTTIPRFSLAIPVVSLKATDIEFKKKNMMK